VRIARVAIADDEQRDLGTGCAVQETIAGELGHVTRGGIVDGPNEVTRLQARPLRRRSIAHADDAEIELPADDQPEVALR